MREERPHNSGFKKLGVQWLNEHSTSHQHLWWFDSFVLRNPQLLKPAKRYGQLKKCQNENKEKCGILDSFISNLD